MTRIRLRHHRLFVHHALALASLAALHGGASAQSGSSQLEVVTITAERRLENIQQVPVSASVLQGEILEAINTGGLDVRGISGRVPSLNIESSFGRAFPRFYIRGYGNTDFRLNASQPVSLVYDDVVQENPILKGFPAFDLERIEVLRGPQGSLFGRNTPAGVVKFDSVKPGPKAEAYGSIALGSYTTVNAEGAATIPLGAGLSTRISVLSQSRKDWVDNTYAPGPTREFEGYRDNALRAQLLAAPSKDFSALFGIHGRDYVGSARLFRANIIKPGTNDFVDGFDIKKVAFDGVNHSELQNYGANARLRWNLGAVTLHSITGYETVRTFSRGDIDGGPPPYVFGGGAGAIPFYSETADGLPDHRQITQELRLESNTGGALSWQAGVYLFNEDYKIESFAYDSTNGGAQEGYLRVRQKNDAYAAFGALNLEVSPAFKLRGGLRYTQDKKTFTTEAYSNSGFVPCVGPTLGIIPVPPRCNLAQLGALGPLAAAPRDSKLSWDVSGTWALSKDVNLYARAATGFRGSSVQGASAFNDLSTARPENNTSIEAGIKADLFDRRARVNFNVFDYRVKDLQVTAVGGANNANQLISVKKATGRGFELDAQAILTAGLVATLGVGYNDTKIKDPNLVVSVCGNGQFVTRPNCTVTDPQPGAGTANINGNPLPQAPKTTASFTLKYTQAAGGGDVYVLTDWVYRSKVNFFLYEAVEFTGKALTEGGLRVGYSWANGRYDVAAYGRNITNQIRIVGGIDFDNLTGFVNEPRTWGVQFRANF